MNIIIDPGHGGHDFGAKGKVSLEKHINLETGMRLVRLLHKYGHKAFATRSADVFTPLHKRTDMANKWPADLFISLHCNGNENPDYHGIECYTYPGFSNADIWAVRFQTALLKAFPDRKDFAGKGPSEANFHVLRETKMPAVLIEQGFITNLEEEKWLIAHTTEIAHVIADELGDIKTAKEI